MLTTKKTIAILILFLIIISSIRFVWISVQTIDHPQAVNGVLDLRGWTIPHNRTIPLDGEWAFYPNQFIESAIESNHTYIPVPGKWDQSFANMGSSSFHYGSYRLQILLDDNDTHTYKLRTNKIENASAIYINDAFVAGMGLPAYDAGTHQPMNIPYSATLPAGTKKIDVIIQVSSHSVEGGITRSIQFGTMDAIDNRVTLSMGLQLLLCIIFFVHALYAIMLYFMGSANKGLLYFACLIFCATLSVLVADDKLLFQWISFSNETQAKLVYLAYIGVGSFIPPLLNNLLPGHSNPGIMRLFAVYCSLFSLYVLAVPTQYIVPAARLLLATCLLTSVVISLFILQSAAKKFKDTIFLLLGCTSVGINIVWAMLANRAVIMDFIFYPFDLIIAVFAFAAFWFKQFFRSNAQTKQLAEKLQRANQQKDDFLINTSHELRNPLHGIINITQSVLEDIEHPPHVEHRERLAIQISVARRMSIILDDLLDVRRLNENIISLQIKPVHLQSILPGVLEMLKFILDGKAIRLHIDLANNFPAVQADENRLIQILFNLLHNAIKFTIQGQISVFAAVKHEIAYISVKDSGIGMDDDMMQRIFLPYEQSNAEFNGGLGLGLSICKQLIELHGGTITVESSLGQGSIFTFTIPLSQKDEFPLELQHDKLIEYGEPAATIIEQRDIPSQAKPKVLLVDDDSINLRILSDILGADQYEITAVTSGEDAIAKLETVRFDLLISDVMMPHMSGYELTRNLRQRFSISELPILLLTARSRMNDTLTGFQVGANDYVTKPVDAWELRSRAKALTELKLSVEERLRLEAAWLHAQIQPHFLFNTLNSIASLGTTDISKMHVMLEEFSNYLRTSFDFHNSDRVVPLSRELALVRSYLYIEQERFGDRLEVQWELETTSEIRIPPFSIQTLVENAVTHGVLQRSRGGTVTIRTTSNADHIEISIQDNGVGISKERLQQILDPHEETSRGIGLRNTDHRLIRLYGAGLQIQSIIDQGTTVSFRIPKS